MLKFERIEPLAIWFAERLANAVQREHLAADIVVPVALHRQKREREGLQPSRSDRTPIVTKTGPSLSSGPNRGRTSTPGACRSAGSRSVALLPHDRAAKLTIYASYW
jgi:hypothetical protein